MLAAGSASRFGAPKQLATVDGVPLVKRALAAAGSACGNHVALVVGADWQAVSSACMPMDGFLLVNDQFADGLGSSIALAVRSLRHVADAIIVVLADQPLVTGHHVSALVDMWSGDDAEIIATAFAGTLGPPALFARGCFDKLMALQGDAGARSLFADERFTLKKITFENAAIDIDVPADLEKL